MAGYFLNHIESPSPLAPAASSSREASVAYRSTLTVLAGLIFICWRKRCRAVLCIQFECNTFKRGNEESRVRVKNVDYNQD